MLGINRIALEYARTEGNDSPALSPDEKAVLVSHPLAEAAKISFGLLLEMQLRPLIHLQIEWVDIVDDVRDVVADAHFDGRRLLGSPQF